MRFEDIGQMTPETWDDLISPFENSLLFHRSAWPRFLQDTYDVRPLRFRIVEGQEVQGYFPALLARKAFFTLLGSPLTGWETDFMGPVFNEGFDFDGFLIALDNWARQKKLDFVQLGHPALPPGVMQKHGYRVQEWETLVVPIYAEKEAM